MFGRPYVRSGSSSLRSSPELVDHIEPIDSGLDELEETLDNLSETLTLSNLSPDPPQFLRSDPDFDIESERSDSSPSRSASSGKRSRRRRSASFGSSSTHHHSSSIDYHSDSEASKMLDEMQYFREKKFFCDITIVVGDKEIEAHRIVLSSCSPYFRAMFTSDLAESKQDKVSLYDVDPDAIEALIDYAYSNKVRICEENVQELLPAARMLQLDYVVDQCGVFLEQHLSIQNCLGFYLFADKHHCEQLLATARRFIQRNFTEVYMKGEEFVQLPAESIIEFLSMDKLNVSSERVLFEAVMKWYNTDRTNRVSHLADVLSYVKLSLLPSSILLGEVLDSIGDVVDVKIKDLLMQAMRYQMQPRYRSSMQHFGTIARKKPDHIATMMAIGGGSQFTTHCECECYSITDDTWYRVTQMSTPRARAGVLELDGFVYSTGGYDGACHLLSMEKYNPSVNEWTAAPSMTIRRSCVGITELDGIMYALGGYDGYTCLDYMERYDPYMEVWMAAPVMTTKRRYVRAVTSDKQIFAVGGFDGTSHLSTVEMFHPDREKWYTMVQMHSQRSGAGVIALDSCIYVVGGNDGCTSLSSVERYDTREGKWRWLDPMHTSRSAVDIAVVDGALYAVGGNDGCSSLNTVEKYDLVAGQWISVASMSMRRSSVGVCIVDIPIRILDSVKVRRSEI
ncbi:hypothetical protein ACHWQZ_G008896 [Mnemiopsis leidyi]